MTDGPAYDEGRPLEPGWLWYVLSFFIPALGLILGALYLGKSEPAGKRFGKNCLIAAAASFALAVCLGLAVVAAAVVIMILSNAAH